MYGERMVVSKAEEIHLALADAQEECGVVDCLINNTGMMVVFKFFIPANSYIMNLREMFYDT